MSSDQKIEDQETEKKQERELRVHINQVTRTTNATYYSNLTTIAFILFFSFSFF